MRSFDAIIVGFGLAGAALSLELNRRGKKLAICDVPASNRSSRVAAGLFSPVTGRMIVKTWKADQLFPSLHSFYRETERMTNEKFFFPFPIYIPFTSVEEQNDWTVRSGEPGLAEFVSTVFTTAHFNNQVNNPLGGMVLKQGGHIDTGLFLDAARRFLSRTQLFLDGPLSAHDVTFERHLVRYNGMEAAAMIFCEGLGARENAFFNWLPLLPLKGEILEIEMEERPSMIYNRGVYVVPSPTGTYKVGATYERVDRPGPTEAGRAELLEKLTALIKMPFEPLHHSWGVRPTTPDRRPILGRHPAHENLLIFNGLGTKGVSLAPYFSSLLADHLEGARQIEKEVNISRFYALYLKS